MHWTIARTTILSALCVAVLILAGCGREDEAQPPEPVAEDASAAVSENAGDSAEPMTTLESRLYAQWREKVKGLDLTRANGVNESNKTMRKLVDGLPPEEFEQLCALVLQQSTLP